MGKKIVIIGGVAGGATAAARLRRMDERADINDPRLRWFNEASGEQESAPSEPTKAGSGPGKSGRKSLATHTAARGGFLVPDQFIGTVLAVAAESSIVRGKATVIRMTSRQVNIPALDQTEAWEGQPCWFGGMQFFWIGEGELIPEMTVNWRRIGLVYKRLVGRTIATQDLLDTSIISLADFLTGPRGFAGGVVWMEDWSFLRGVGGVQPLGILNSPGTLELPRQTEGRVTWTDCVEMLKHALPSDLGEWVFNHALLSDMVQLAGPDGNPSFIWQTSARDAPPARLLGLPVRWTEKLPYAGRRGDILYANFGYYLIGDPQVTTIDASEHPRWLYDELTWRVIHRIDGQPWLSAPLPLADGEHEVSPFVVLSGPAGS